MLCPKVNFAAVFAELLPHSELAAAERCGVNLAQDLIKRLAFLATRPLDQFELHTAQLSEEQNRSSRLQNWHPWLLSFKSPPLHLLQKPLLLEQGMQNNSNQWPAFSILIGIFQVVLARIQVEEICISLHFIICSVKKLLAKSSLLSDIGIVCNLCLFSSQVLQFTSATHALLSCVKGWYDCNTVKHVIPLNTFSVFY